MWMHNNIQACICTKKEHMPIAMVSDDDWHVESTKFEDLHMTSEKNILDFAPNTKTITSESAGHLEEVDIEEKLNIDEVDNIVQ